MNTWTGDKAALRGGRTTSGIAAPASRSLVWLQRGRKEAGPHPGSIRACVSPVILPEFSLSFSFFFISSSFFFLNNRFLLNALKTTFPWTTWISPVTFPPPEHSHDTFWHLTPEQIWGRLSALLTRTPPPPPPPPSCYLSLTIRPPDTVSSPTRRWMNEEHFLSRCQWSVQEDVSLRPPVCGGRIGTSVDKNNLKKREINKD